MFCLVLALAPGAAGPAGVPAPDFWGQPVLDARIDPGRLNRELLAMAIFHETNRVREKLGLRRLQLLPKLTAAADLEAALGNVSRPPSHTNPFPQIGTPRQRVEYVGLKSREVAENIALLSIYEIDPSVGVEIMVRDGQRHFVDPSTQKDLKPATYRGFAMAVVNAWMQSPGHRANLVSPTLLCLGCSVQPTASLLGVESLFCVQVFFTPADQP